MRWRAWRRCRSRGICRREPTRGSATGRPRRPAEKRPSSWPDRRRRLNSSTGSTGATWQGSGSSKRILQQGRFAKADSLIAEIRRALDAGVGADDPVAREAMFDALVRMRVRHVLARADWTNGLEANVRAQGCDAPSAASTATFAVTLSASLPDSVVAVAVLLSHRLSVDRDVMRIPAGILGGAAGVARREGRSSARRPRASTNASAAPTAASPRSSSSCASPCAPRSPPGRRSMQELELLLMHASDLEERLLRSGQLVLPFAPVAEIAGDLFHQANRFEQARRRYSDALIARPNRARRCSASRVRPRASTIQGGDRRLQAVPRCVDGCRCRSSRDHRSSRVAREATSRGEMTIL